MDDNDDKKPEPVKLWPSSKGPCRIRCVDPGGRPILSLNLDPALFIQIVQGIRRAVLEWQGTAPLRGEDQGKVPW